MSKFFLSPSKSRTHLVSNLHIYSVAGCISGKHPFLTRNINTPNPTTCVHLAPQSAVLQLCAQKGSFEQPCNLVMPTNYDGRECDNVISKANRDGVGCFVCLHPGCFIHPCAAHNIETLTL